MKDISETGLVNSSVYKSYMINAERDRRVREGTIITLPSGVGVHVEGGEGPTANLHGLCSLAQILISQGLTTEVIKFRDGSNVVHDLVPEEIVYLFIEGAKYKSTIFEASWNVKALTADNTLPANYTDDSAWAV